MTREDIYLQYIQQLRDIQLRYYHDRYNLDRWFAEALASLPVESREPDTQSPPARLLPGRE